MTPIINLPQWEIEKFDMHTLLISMQINLMLTEGGYGVNSINIKVCIVLIISTPSVKTCCLIRKS